MSNVTAKIDANDRGTWTAYNATTGLVERVYCDPVTNALLVFGVPTDGNTPTTLNTAKIDANDRNTLLALNDTSGLVEALRCDSNGSLLVISQ